MPGNKNYYLRVMVSDRLLRKEKGATMKEFFNSTMNFSKIPVSGKSRPMTLFATTLWKPKTDTMSDLSGSKNLSTGVSGDTAMRKRLSRYSIIH